MLEAAGVPAMVAWISADEDHFGIELNRILITLGSKRLLGDQSC